MHTCLEIRINIALAALLQQDASSDAAEKEKSAASLQQGEYLIAPLLPTEETNYDI